MVEDFKEDTHLEKMTTNLSLGMFGNKLKANN